MKRKLQAVILAVLLPAALFAEPPNPWKTREYSVVEIEGRFGVYTGIYPIILDFALKKKSPNTYLEAIEAFGPAFVSRLSSSGIWEWHFSDGSVYFAQPKWGGPLLDKIELKEKESDRLQFEPHKTTKPKKAEDDNSL